jgi:arabinogalactan endo-1,4-beta-galactosidase
MGVKMAVDFEALDFIRSRNKQKRAEAIKQQQREQKEKNIKYFMEQLSEIKRDHDLCQDPAVKKLLLDKWLGVVKLCVKKINA